MSTLHRKNIPWLSCVTIILYCNCVTSVVANSDAYFIYGAGYGVHKMDMNGNHFDAPFFWASRFSRSPTRLDYDNHSGAVFVTNSLYNKILKGRLDWKGKTKVIIDNTLVRLESKIHDIAVDWIGRKVYWTDTVLNTIEVADFDGSNRMVLYSNRLDSPDVIAVDPFRKYLYWSNMAGNSSIERISMDGADDSHQVLVNTSIVTVIGITIDYSINRIFWIDGTLKTLESMSLDGSDRRLVARLNVTSPTAFTIFGENVYFWDWSERRYLGLLCKVNKLTGKNYGTVGTWANKPVDLKVIHSSRQPNGINPCAPNNGGCSHLCLLSAVTTTFTCKCPEGMKMSSNGKTCYAPWRGAYLISASVYNGVHKISLNGSDTKNVKWAPRRSVAVDIDIESDTLFLTREQSKNIYKTSLKGDGQLEVFADDIRSRNCMVSVDWIGRKIYWTDDVMNTIEVAELDGSNRIPLFTEGLDNPLAIVVHPFIKYVYWSDRTYPHGRIERASMDGAVNSREVLVNTSIGRVSAMTIDYEADRVFWVDNNLGKIESMALDGSDRKLVTSIWSQDPVGITVLGDYLYYTSSPYSNGAIIKIDKSTGVGEILVKKVPWARDIKVVHPSRQKNGINPCAPNNGGCSHLCLLSAVTETFTCKCPDGMKLSSNGKTCYDIFPDAHVMYTSIFSAGKIALNTSLSNQKVKWPSQISVGLDFDIQSDTVFWTSSRNSGNIFKTNLNGTASLEVVVDKLKSVGYVAVDWIGRKIYWTDFKRNTIEVAELDGSKRMVLYSDGLNSPCEIAVDPFGKFVYWVERIIDDKNPTTTQQKPRSIKRASMGGEANSIKVLVNTSIGMARGLTIDYDTNQLFWSDSILKKIESIALDGSDRKVIANTPFQKLTALSVLGDHLYFANLQNDALSRRYKSPGREYQRTLAIGIVSPFDIKTVHRSRQRKGINHCAPNNGGCSHLCLLSAVTTTFTCKCPDGMMLSSSGKLCVNTTLASQSTATTAMHQTTRNDTIASQIVKGSQTNDTTLAEDADGDDSSMPKAFLPVAAVLLIVALLATVPFTFGK